MGAMPCGTPLGMFVGDRMVESLARYPLSLAILALTALSAFGQEPDDGIEKALTKPIELNLENVSLREALATVSKKLKSPIITDRRALESEWIDDQELKVTLQSKDQPFEPALEAMLRPHGLCWIKRHEVLLITTPQAAANQYSEVRLYKATRKLQVARRVHSIQTSVAPDSWKVNGGTGDMAPLPPDFIVIRQSPLIHREITRAFAHSIAPVVSGSQTKSGNGALDKALNSHASINAVKSSLSSILEQLAKKHAIEIKIDDAATADSAIDPQSLNITLQADVPRLSSALSLVLELANPDLIWIAQGNTLKITTKSIAAKSRSTRRHEIADLVPKVDGKYLVEAIEYNLSPETWQFGGGEGAIEWTDEGKLVVLQSEPVHREVEKLLAEIRTALKPPATTK